jgi:hypothetical protein
LTAQPASQSLEIPSLFSDIQAAPPLAFVVEPTHLLARTSHEESELPKFSICPFRATFLSRVFGPNLPLGGPTPLLPLLSSGVLGVTRPHENKGVCLSVWRSVKAFGYYVGMPVREYRGRCGLCAVQRLAVALNAESNWMDDLPACFQRWALHTIWGIPAL